MSSTRPILITGGRGQIGQELQRALSTLGELAILNRPEFDLNKPDTIVQCFARYKPAVIVNAAAYTSVDGAEKEERQAFSVNAEGVGILAETAASLGTPVVHYSTDYVFEGTGKLFQSEINPTSPINIYGKSKLAGEQNLRARQPNSWVLRTSWVFGLYGDNFLKTILRLWQMKPELSIVADQYGVPTAASLIADVTALLVYKVLNDTDVPEPGVYHLAPNGVTTWHEYAQVVLACAQSNGLHGQFSPDSIQAISTSSYPTPAARPLNSRLDCSKLEGALSIEMPDWKGTVEQVVNLITRECVL